MRNRIEAHKKGGGGGGGERRQAEKIKIVKKTLRSIQYDK
jgi:hypothetical protein